MEEINIKDLVMYFIKKSPIIILISVFVMSIGLFYGLYLKQPLYYGNVTLILVQENDGYQSSTLTQSDIALNQKLVTTYSEIVKSKRVLNKVIDVLGLDYTVSELASKISVSSVKDTEIIKITVSDPDNELAARIANRTASIFENEVRNIYNLENVSVIDEAFIQDTPYNINVLRDVLIFFMIGFVLASGIFFVVYYFDTSIKSADELEKVIGLPVIGTIPLSNNRKGKNK